MQLNRIIKHSHETGTRKSHYQNDGQPKIYGANAIWNKCLEFFQKIVIVSDVFKVMGSSFQTLGAATEKACLPKLSFVLGTIICWQKLKSLSKTTSRLRTVFDGNVSLPSSLTGKWLMTLFRCCLVPIIIKSVFSGLSFSLLDSIQNKISVRQSFKVKTDSCAFDCESDM